MLLCLGNLVVIKVLDQTVFIEGSAANLCTVLDDFLL